ncbi:MAG: hypothetical protein ABIF85_04445 [Nanoarchaeota archaeon]|nr:hypothetical protein [Nanoarchaeota archaeon]MBU4300008.1 hypothetical protein [Nanoarchaeota archaeon]MBU4451170.1 hypothetical protein [Nanoarchaeota archaeon]MCG2724313.1 hypothetical protein [archaeon]
MPKNALLDELLKSDRESARKLNELLSIIARNRSVYETQRDPAIAQLWLAIVEIYARQEKLQRQVSQLSRPEIAVSKETASARIKKLLKNKKDGSDNDILETLDNY